jgi:uncharacterized protein YecT (DUF1311 family)
MMKALHMTTAACAVLLCAQSAQADEIYDKCVNASSDNASWGECGGALIQREDAKLNAVWKRFFPSVGGQTKADLLAEQRAWVVFREASCKFYANGDYGREGQVLDYPVCVADMIASRTKTIEELSKDLARK